MRYNTYLIANGKIESSLFIPTIDTPPLDFEWVSPEKSIILAINQEIGDSPSQYYVDTLGTPTVTLRPAPSSTIDKTNIIADGIDKAIISNIPNPSSVTIIDINGKVEIEVTDGLLEVAAEGPQTITINIEAFPELNFSTEITAT